ncbi:DUF5076 domain-containing protein [Adhaeretor mobilis]|uniref:DUF5076 domain-containing protein n=1 Tax=Adhaeretor mobilis TaxID=1930276 RepID=A0A517N0C9_9BACT|nr:DUF5076 domain-containing protein [Adhaeretor mobilis]QDT00592.1 hypothetical protein HG15A2_39310 [Adhaeretor mobilis]
MITTHNNQLPIPNPVEADAKARELLRVWAGGGKQHVALATGLWKDPANWGIMLVDLAKHLARAYEQTDNLDQAQSLARIKAGFDAEWNSATDNPEGGIEQEKGS